MSEEGTVVETSEENLEGAPPEVSDVEERARRQGWRPEAEFRGPPGKWVDAETFLRRGETELPILRERLRTLDNRFANAEREITEANRKQADTIKVLNEIREMSKTAEERAYARAQMEFAERERKAVASAAVDEYDRIQIEKRQLDATRPKLTSTPPEPPKVETPPVVPQTNPTIDAWIADNPWFNMDPVMNACAIAEDASIQKEMPHLGMSDRLTEVKKRVVARFPEKFGNPRRAAPPAVTTTNLAPPPSSKKKTIKDLPKEAQEAFERFKKQMPTYTEDEYLAVYGEM